MLVKSAEVKCRGTLTKSGVQQPFNKALLADLTVQATLIPGCRWWIFQGLKRLINWAHIDFEPT